MPDPRTVQEIEYDEYLIARGVRHVSLNYWVKGIEKPRQVFGPDKLQCGYKYYTVERLEFPHSNKDLYPDYLHLIQYRTGHRKLAEHLKEAMTNGDDRMTGLLLGYDPNLAGAIYGRD